MAEAVPVVNQIRTYWWCSPPRTGRQRMVPATHVLGTFCYLCLRAGHGLVGWGGRVRTSVLWNQNPLPATPPQPLNRVDSRLREAFGVKAIEENEQLNCSEFTGFPALTERCCGDLE